MGWLSWHQMYQIHQIENKSICSYLLVFLLKVRPGLRLTHRLPDQLSGLVNDFAKYGGLGSAPEVASRRLTLDIQPDIEYRDIIQPSEITTWVDINQGIEEPIGPSSWANETEAKTCARI